MSVGQNTNSKPQKRAQHGWQRWPAFLLCVLAGAVAAQIVPEMPRPSAAPAAPAGPTEAEKKAERKAAAQRAQDKRDADRRMAEAVAQADRERQAREKLAAEKRRLEAEKSELDRQIKIAADQAKAALALPPPAPPAPVPAVPTPPTQTAPYSVARHPHMGQALAARQTFVDSWGQGTARESAPRMVVIPPAPVAGFLMGSPPEEAGRDTNEKLHRVSIAYVFALGETEITYAQWNACVADGGCGFDKTTSGSGRDQHPVVNVNWHAARAYTDWLNNRLRLARNDPYRYRLPTEAEWEYAARAGSAGPFGLGQNRNLSPDLANYDSRASYMGSPTRDWLQGPMPVGSYPVSAFGTRDMLGNVWEWVADCYEADYDRTPKDGSAYRENDLACPARIVRGGSWYFTPPELRAANRNWAAAAYHDNKGGFRIARTLLPRN